jgi:hypothetical protein
MSADFDNQQHEEQGDFPLSAFFYFPCYSGDDGSRPAPSTSLACSYRSPAILVNGKPHDGKFLSPNQTLELSVEVTNQGALAATAMVTILYAPMSASFTNDLRVAAQLTDFWQAGETKTVGPEKWTIPADLPSHVCLLAAVDSILDPIPTPLPQSIADRHYAQCNIDFLEVAPGTTISVPFLMGFGRSPSQGTFVRVRVDLSAGAIAYAHSQLLVLEVELARSMRPILESRQSQMRGDVLEFDQREGDQEIKLVVQMPRLARAGQAVLLVVEHFATSREDERPLLIGSLGFVLVAQS